jgi:FlaA1/EpsC-like NDP-sugar epimerase
MKGGEIFSPKMSAIKITDLAKSFRSNPQFDEIGIRPGEKLSEDLVLNCDAKRTYEHENFFITYPNGQKGMGKKVEPDFTYNSDDCLGTLGEIA